jgi:hypothetical protein
MAWERGYYYQVKKIRGRVVRQYIGKGIVAEVMAAGDELIRRERAVQQTQTRLLRAELDVPEPGLLQLDESADLLARAILLAAGCHQHHRGEWRRRRG